MPSVVCALLNLYFRLLAGVPIVMVGDTGCGKTLLVRYLMQLLRWDCHVLDVHAGVSRAIVATYINRAIQHRSGQRPVVLFLDESNTSPEVDTFKELVCDRHCGTTHIPRYLGVVAACNPVKQKRGKGRQSSVPQSSQVRGVCTDRAPSAEDLVYKVHSMPPTMHFFEWQMAFPSPDEEHTLIMALMTHRRMAEVLDSRELAMFGRLVAASAIFVRSQTEYMVSLRDVQRAISVAQYFRGSVESAEPGLRCPDGVQIPTIITRPFLSQTAACPTRCPIFIAHGCLADTTLVGLRQWVSDRVKPRQPVLPG